MTDITPMISAVITLLSAVVTVFLIPWIKRQTSAKDREELLKWVEIAVAAAEQLFDSAHGEDKKQAVMEFLRKKGLVFSEAEIDTVIEAVVLKLHRGLEETAGS